MKQQHNNSTQQANSFHSKAVLFPRRLCQLLFLNHTSHALVANYGLTHKIIDIFSHFILELFLNKAILARNEELGNVFVLFAAAMFVHSSELVNQTFASTFANAPQPPQLHASLCWIELLDKTFLVALQFVVGMTA